MSSAEAPFLQFPHMSAVAERVEDFFFGFQDKVKNWPGKDWMLEVYDILAGYF